MAEIKLTTGWRVTIPKEIRRALSVRPKDRIEFTMLSNANAAQLRAVPRTSARGGKVQRRK